MSGGPSVVIVPQHTPLPAWGRIRPTPARPSRVCCYSRRHECGPRIDAAAGLAPARRAPRGPRVQPGVGRRAVRARRRPVFGAPGVTLAALFGPQHGFRVGPAGQHDRVAARARRAAARARLLALQRDARADGRHAATGSTCSSSTCRTSARASTRSSTRWPTACAPPRGTTCPSSSATGPIRSAATRSKARARAGLRVVRRALPDPDAPRDDHRRTRAAVQRRTSASAPTSRSCAWTAGRAGMYFDETGLPVGDAVAEHADARHGHRLSRRGALRGHATLRRPRARPGRSSSWAPRGSTRSASRRS